jgi:signal transduction histidine kinase
VVLQTIALNARALTGAELAAAGIGGDATRPFEIWAHVGVPPEQVARIGRPPRPVGLLGLVVEEDRAIKVGDVRQHPRHLGLPPQHPAIRSLLAVPIRFRAQVVGNLYLANKEGAGEFTLEDQHLAEMLAARAGGAVETARRYAAEGRAHAWLQDVIDQMPEGVLLMDAAGHITMQNRLLRSFMNAASPIADRFGNAVTIDLRDPAGTRLAPDHLPVVKAIADREVTVGRELVGRQGGDRSVPLLVSAAPILMANGTVAGAVMVCHDISALKEVERLRGEWASIVAHELGQPISVIVLRSSLLLQGHLSAEQRDSVERITSSAHTLTRMVSDLMDASLVEGGHLRVTLSRLDLGRLLMDVSERVPLAAARTRIHTPAAVCVFVKGDADRLEQVMTNLLSNAVRYAAPETDIGVNLRVDGEQAHVTVTNLGAGIPADELSFVFERFARSRSTGAGAVKGLGLGLYIARGLVTAHGGRIWVDSVPGDVTTFHFTIPLDGPPVAVAPLPPKDSDPSSRGARQESS